MCVCWLLLIIFLFIIEFIWGCAGSLLLCGLFPRWRDRLLSPWSTASSTCRLWYFQLLGARTQAQQLWLMGLVAPWHVGFSWTRDRTCVSCTRGKILYHWATGKAPHLFCLQGKHVIQQVLWWPLASILIWTHTQNSLSTCFPCLKCFGALLVPKSRG